MKLKLTFLPLFLILISAAAFAGTTPKTMHISCDAPNPNGQIACNSGGDGKPIDFSAGWENDVYDYEIKVRRKDSGNSYSSSATVAEGGLSGL